MKNAKCLITVFMFLLCLFPGSHIMADIYVKGEINFQSRYAYGITEPEGKITMEWWLGKDKILFSKSALTNSNNYQTDSPLKLILDPANHCYILLDEKGKTFVSIPQKTAPLQSMAKETVARFADINLSGWVKMSPETTSHLNTPCDVIKVNEKVNIKDRIYYDKDRTLMVAQKLPFDWKPLVELALHMRGFFNPKDEYMSQLKNIRGFVMSSNDTRYHEGNKIETRFEILEIKEKKPPKGIYDVPAGFKNTGKLTIGQAWGIFDTLYPWGW